jgi:TM2 domain-containing membrane protein YozV
MPVIQCPDCGNQVSDAAPACIHCGRPMGASRAPQDSRSTRVRRQASTAVETRVASERKSTGLAYVLWFFLGTLGIHNFYLGRTVLGLVQVACFVLGPLSMILGLLGIVFSTAGDPGQEPSTAGLAIGSLGFLTGIIAAVVLGVTLLVDLFTIPSAVTKHADSLRRRYS